MSGEFAMGERFCAGLAQGGYFHGVPAGTPPQASSLKLKPQGSTLKTLMTTSLSLAIG